MTRTPNEQVYWASERLQRLGLNRGTAGNVSLRDKDGFTITPSGLKVEATSPADMVWVSWDGSWSGPHAPSSEWRMHRDILMARQDVQSVVHTHAPFSTALACQRKAIPAFHYMIALAGGDSIRCAPYALFGTQALSDAAVNALSGRKACLLANHGMVAIGRDIEEAVDIALEVETLSEQYWRVLQMGAPVLLSEDEMAEVIEQFKGYGRWKTAQSPNV